MTILWIIVAIFGIGLIYLASKPGKFNVSESITVKAPVGDVFNKILDLKTWANWSPWVMHEPDVKLNFSDDIDQEGGHYSWDGAHIGSGKLMHVKLETNARILQKITFLKPFKNTADIEWSFAEETEGTKLTWQMHGSMPFFFRWMVPMMIRMISSDYKVGLRLLNQLLDPSAPKFQVQFDGAVDREALSGISQHFQGSFEQLPQAMEKSFTHLLGKVESENLKISSHFFAAYSKTDIKKMTTQCDMVVPIESLDEIDAEKYTAPAGKYFKITYNGRYDYLEQVWFSAASHLRMHKIKWDTNRPSLEIYIADPRNAEPDQLVTELYLPIR